MDYRRNMVDLAIRHSWVRGAMLGLGSGVLLEMMLSSAPDLSIVGVDHFVRPDRKVRVLKIASKFKDRCLIHCSTTAKASELVPDESLDFVYIDAGHKYGCVRSDLRLWWGKVKTGGWFGGHDYHADYPGVVAAVSERFGADVSVDGNTVWSVVKS